MRVRNGLACLPRGANLRNGATSHMQASCLKGREREARWELDVASAMCINSSEAISKERSTSIAADAQRVQLGVLTVASSYHNL